MKNSFPSFALIAATGFAGSTLAAVAGLPWPTAFDAGHSFGAFVAVLTLLIAFADYAPRSTLHRTTILPPSRRNSAAQRATATEERRLAA